ncbi:MAG: hypothetical protein HQK57_03750 [Deltaproteobacteria bacterium]|nr:hypothetical protein [Deltaproteobacteria bacterium]MBF0524755.1 hypothetical protein [Deltaproteobacteria bacterium]
MADVINKDANGAETAQEHNHRVRTGQGKGVHKTLNIYLGLNGLADE